MKMATDKVLETGTEKIREMDLIVIKHKDGRPISGQLTKIKDNMIYIRRHEGIEVVKIESVVTAEKIG